MMMSWVVYCLIFNVSPMFWFFFKSTFYTTVPLITSCMTWWRIESRWRWLCSCGVQFEYLTFLFKCREPYFGRKVLENNNKDGYVKCCVCALSIFTRKEEFDRLRVGFKREKLVGGSDIPNIIGTSTAHPLGGKVSAALRLQHCTLLVQDISMERFLWQKFNFAFVHN